MKMVLKNRILLIGAFLCLGIFELLDETRVKSEFIQIELCSHSQGLGITDMEARVIFTNSEDKNVPFQIFKSQHKFLNFHMQPIQWEEVKLLYEVFVC